MTEPKPIPDFGPENYADNEKAILARQQFIKEHADYFTVVRRYTKLGQMSTLEGARSLAKTLYNIINDGQPLLIYAVYGPYDSWIETYGGEKKQTKT